MTETAGFGVSAELIAPAKLTLSLAITGLRADGYHLIDAEMVSLDLADRVTVVEGPPSLNIIGPYADGIPTDPSNLVMRALALVGRSAAITIDKQIPHGGGLGGGSTDAAAILRWARFHDLAAASLIGADVPFCVAGGRARVRGIGEIVEPIPFQAQTFTLIIPPLQVPTPSVYRAFDELDAANPPGPNHLEAAAIAVEPTLADWRDRIIAESGLIPVLAGSGATWFVHGGHGNALAALCNEGAHVLETSTVPGFGATS